MSPDGGGPAGIAPREVVVATEPFTIRRTTRWSECDPAGVVYAGNFADYVLSASELFKTHLGVLGRLRPEGRTFDTPAKALDIVFKGSLWPEDAFDMVVYAGEVRRRTSDVLIAASRVDDGSAVFQGRLTSIYIPPGNRRETVPVPEAVRGIYLAYAGRHPAPVALRAALAPGLAQTERQRPS